MVKKILCFGEVSWDTALLSSDRTKILKEGPGGCALNSAYGLKALGASVVLGGNPLGEDLHGISISRDLELLGIENRLVRSPTVKTAHCHCFLEPSTGERSFEVFHQDIQRYEQRSLADLPAEISKGVYPQIFIQHYIRDLSQKLLEESRTQDAWLLMQDMTLDSPFLGLSDAIQQSMEESIEFNEESVFAMAAPFFKGRVKEIFITAGSRGLAYVEFGKKPVMYQAMRVSRVVDTTGCGDAWRAGYMVARAKGHSVGDSIAQGQKVAAYKAGVLGSNIRSPMPVL